MQKRKTAVLSTTLAALFVTGVAAVHAEQTTLPGKGQIADCEACHGTQGRAPLNGLIPKICEQNIEYLIMTLVQFSDGSRPSPIMRETTKNLSRELIGELADYFANSPCSGN